MAKMKFSLAQIVPGLNPACFRRKVGGWDVMDAPRENSLEVPSGAAAHRVLVVRVRGGLMPFGLSASNALDMEVLKEK